MVKQKQERKPSSTRKAEYRFPCSIEPVSLVPDSVEVKQVDDLSSVGGLEQPGYVISGALKDVRESWWAEPPHIAFANLLAEKPESVESFTRRYGVLSRLYMDRDDPDGRTFTIDSATFLVKQDTLRDAWEWMAATEEEGHPKQGGSSVSEIEGEVEEGFDADVVVSGGFVELRPKDIWTSICFLFLWDAQAGKLGVCENPDCPAPYFRRKRRTQKFCEAGPCVAYAQRQYSLDWWNRVGKKRREKKLSKIQNKGKKQ